MYSFLISSQAEKEESEKKRKRKKGIEKVTGEKAQYMIFDEDEDDIKVLELSEEEIISLTIDDFRKNPDKRR